jgi:hypothetical protein
MMTAKERKVIRKVVKEMLKCLDKMDEILDRLDRGGEQEQKEYVVKEHYC